MAAGRSRSYFFEELALGQEATLETTVSQADIVQFADISGDRNPVHLDPEYCAGTMFKEPIAHGMLTASYISAVFGMHLPGPGAIYISQTLNFRGPVRIGDTVRTQVRLVELYPAKKRARFDCECTVSGKPVLVGEAMLMVPGRTQ